MTYYISLEMNFGKSSVSIYLNIHIDESFEFNSLTVGNYVTTSPSLVVCIRVYFRNKRNMSLMIQSDILEFSASK